MSYRPLSPGKTEKDGSARDRLYLLQAAIDFDTPFVPEPAFPCYVPTVCAPPLAGGMTFPSALVTGDDEDLVTELGDFIIAGEPEP